MRIYEGHVYSLDSAVAPLTPDFNYYFLSIPGKKRGFVHYGFDRWYEIGSESRLFLKTRSKKGVWSSKQLKVPFVRNNNRLEFDLPAYLTELGIKTRLYKNYDFLHGCDTNYHMIYCKNAIVCSGSEYVIDYPMFWVRIEFPRPFLTVNGKPVLLITDSSGNQFNGFNDFIKEHLEEPADLTYPQLLELAHRFADNPCSTSFEIWFRDRSIVKGNTIDWVNNTLK